MAENNHGGSRIGAGRPRKSLAKALDDGTRKSRLKQIQFENKEILEPDTPTVPEIMAYLKEPQRDGEALLAEEFFRDMWDWLVDRKCEKLFDKHYLQRFALQQARCVQIEKQISKMGFLAKNDKGLPVISPLEIALEKRTKVLNQMQNVIAVAVRENCTENYTGETDYQDPMEQLLRMGKR
ncbi:hypothetical protein FACS1894133_4540 [Clostridia bacterium]|nr:hypothetical protein FACS1894133_4540 [Clostridia bacterium]